MEKKVKRFVETLGSVLKRPEMLILPGQLAFFFILSVVPILTIIGYGVVSFNLSLDTITSFLSRNFGQELTNLIMPHFSDIHLSFTFIITLCLGFFFASNGASSIIITSNTIYGIKDQGIVRRRIKSIIMTIFMVVLFLFILLVPLFGEQMIAIADLLNSNTGEFIKTVIKILNGPVSWLIIFFFIKLLYTMAPDKTIKSSQTTYGALFTTIGWIVATAIYSFYIHNIANYSLFYGSLANIIILMLWTYLLAYIFTIGLALNYNKHEIKEEKKVEKITNIKNKK